MVLAFSTISTWQCGHKKINVLLDWCNEHCEARVNHITLPTNKHQFGGPGQAFAFDLESDLLLFTLAWR